MRRSMLPLLALALALPAQAQTPHVGFGLTLNIPTGGFSQTKYPAYTASNGDEIGVQTAGYDTGLAGYFTLSFPVDRTLAFRLNLSGGSEDGSNTAVITPTVGSAYSDRQNLRHTMFSIGGDMQIFLQGGALRHSGTYLVGGISADFERFDQGYGDLNDYYYYDNPNVTTERKSRMGGTFGIGHSFGRAIKFNMEFTYHTTLTGKGELDPPATNMARLGFGVVF
ncbi:MAG TPA: outer membrane beta-barrel protein [Holophagaceae bacterium]|nr:outer membrane beta-barrel protein [Holophagaceae bacterium]